MSPTPEPSTRIFDEWEIELQRGRTEYQVKVAVSNGRVLEVDRDDD